MQIYTFTDDNVVDVVVAAAAAAAVSPPEHLKSSRHVILSPVSLAAFSGIRSSKRSDRGNVQC